MELAYRVNVACYSRRPTKLKGGVLTPRERASVSLRVRHPSKSPSEVTEALQLDPQYSWQAGDRRLTPAGALLSGRHTRSYWSRVVGNGETVEETLTNALDVLQSRKSSLQALLAAGHSVELYVGWFATSGAASILTSDMLKELSTLGIDLALAVYPPNAPEDIAV
jgi:hypothetical protein